MSAPAIDAVERSQTLRAQFAKALKEVSEAEQQRAAAQDMLRKNVDEFMAFLQSLRKTLEAQLRVGGEKRAMIELIAQHTLWAEDVSAMLLKTRPHFQDSPTLQLMDSYVKEADAVVEWMQRMAQWASKSAPPLDESKLPPDPGCKPQGQAEGYVSIAEARRRLSR